MTNYVYVFFYYEKMKKNYINENMKNHILNYVTFMEKKPEK